MKYILLLFCLTFYLIYSGFINGSFEPDVKDSITIVYPTRNVLGSSFYQEFFSDFMSVIGAMCYGLHYGAAAIKINFDNPLYIANPNENYFDYFFETSLFVLNPAINLSNAKVVKFDSLISRFGKMGSFSHIAFSTDKTIPFPVYQYRSRANLHSIINPYIKPKQFVLDEVNKVKSTWGTNFIIGVHFRGSDNKVSFYGLTKEEYINTINICIDKVIQHYQKPFVIFATSDEQEFIDRLKQRYPGKVTNSPFQKLDPNDLSTQVALHKSTRLSNFDKGFSVLVDMLLLSSTNFIIKNRSCVSDVSLIWNPYIDFIYVYGKRNKAGKGIYCSNKDIQ